jgi:two-component system NtrC family sensor kinase
MAQRMLAGIAHELNNPLQAVQNSLRLFLHRSETNAAAVAGGNGSNVTKYYRYLLMAEQEIEHVSDVVQRMLDMYRSDPERMHPIPVHTLLRETVATMTPHLQQRQIALALELAPRLPAVMGIHSQLAQVFRSLIQNAIDAMPRGGTLTIRSQLVEEQAGPHTTDVIMVEVSDTGHGIPAEHLSQVFEPFFTTHDNGVGLGLATSHGIIQQHRGTLSVQSVPNQHTTFRIQLPTLAGPHPALGD